MAVSVDEVDRCPPLAVLRRAARQAFARAAREVTFEEGERLVPLLRPPRRYLIIMDGLAGLVCVTQTGVERILYVFHPCEITGSHVLLKESSEAPYEIVAIGKVRALLITEVDFMAVVRDHPEVLIAVTAVFSMRLAKLTDRLMAAMSIDVPVRLCKLLLDFADTEGEPSAGPVPLIHPLTHEMMAQIIGASRPHTSTVLGDLEKNGVVQRQSAKGLLVYPSRLEEIISRESIKPD